MTRKREKKKPPINESEQVHGIQLTEVLLYVLAVGWLPFLFVCLLQLRQPRGQLILLVSLILSLGLSWWLGRHEKPMLKADISYLSGLVLFGCLLMTSLVLWNYSFRFYTSAVDFSLDIFRTKFRNLRAPLYGYLYVPEVKQFFYPALSCGFFLTYMLRNRKETVEGWGMPTSAFFLLLLSMSLALKDHVSRVVEWMAFYGGFTQGLKLFSGMTDLLHNYTSNMNQLGTHANHYPPGIFMLMKAEEILNMQALTRFVVMSSGVATIYVVRGIARLFDLSNSATQLAILFFVLSPGVLTFITLDPAFIVLLPGSLTLYFYLKGLITGRQSCAIAMGLFFSLSTFFSFSSGFIALLMGILLLIAWRWRMVRLTKGLQQIGLSIATFAGLFTLLYLMTGFQLLDCLREAIRNNSEQMSNGFDNIFRYLLRSTGAVLAYLTAAGFPQSFLAAKGMLSAVKVKDDRSWQEVLAVGLPICLLVSAFSGCFFLETERIWLFFTPFLVVSAGTEGDTLYCKSGFRPIAALLACSLIMAAGYELLHRPFPWR
jgi:hypothetical protein